MYQILIATLPIVNAFGFDKETRRKLANEILNQQDNGILIGVKI